MYGYVYKITNKINGKIYVGKRVKDIFDVHYWGSGMSLKMAINEYGRENFEREVLEWCATKEQLESREVYWIACLQSTNPDVGYNLTIGGGGGATTHNYRWVNNGCENKYIKDTEDIPEGFTLGRLMHLDNKDSIWINDGVDQKHIKKDQLYLYPNWTLGMLYRGDEWRSKLKQVANNRDYTTQQHIKEGILRYHEEHPHKTNTGSFKRGQKAHNKGKITITDGTCNKYIQESELEYWLALGWCKKATQKHKEKQKA